MKIADNQVRTIQLLLLLLGLASIFPLTVIADPPTTVEIPAVKLTVGGSEKVIDLSTKFTHTGSATLTYTAKSSDKTKVTVSLSDANLTITAVSLGTATVTVTANHGGTRKVKQTFDVTVVSAPVAQGSIPAMRIASGGSVDLRPYFSDADNDPLTYTAESSDETKVTVRVSGNSLEVTAVELGTATVTVTAIDPNSLRATQTFNVTVVSAPVAQGSIPAVKLTVGGSAATVDVSSKFSDADGNTLTYTAESSNTARVRVSVSSANVTITPVAQGTATVTVTATDPDNLTATQNITVTVNAPIAVGSIPAVRLTVGGSAATVDVSTKFSDPNNDPLIYTASSDTAKVRVSVLRANVTITPVAQGTATVTVTATDPDNLTAEQTIAVTVNGPPTAVGAIPAVKLTLGGSAATVNVSTKFSDPDNDRLTYTAVSNDETKATARVSSANVLITPVALGTATVTVTATDPDNQTARQTIAVTVVSAPVAQGAIPAVKLTLGGSAATVNVSTRFSDADNDRLTYTAESSNRARVSVSVSSANVLITGVALGTATVTVTATDTNNLTATQNIAVTVVSAPVAQGSIPAVKLTVGGSAFIVDVSSKFSDADNDRLTYTAESSNTAKVRVSVSGTNVTITPVAQGTATVTVTATDTNSLTATQTIAVTVNGPPTAQGSIPAVRVTVGGSAATVDVSGNFSDPDNDRLTYTAESSNTAKVRVSVSSASVTITPVAQGTATVTVTATDTNNLRATQTIAVTVNPNQAPVAQGTPNTVTIAVRSSSTTVDVSSYFSDPDGNPLTYTAKSSDKTKATASVSESAVTITPVAQGGVLIVVTARDPSNLTATQNIAVTVSPGANRAPVAQGAIPTVTITERGNPRNVDVSSYFSDPDNNSLTYRASSSHPSQATVDVSGSVVTITPVAQGTPTITVTASDPSNLTATQKIAVTVSPGANRAPVAQGAIPTVTIAERGNPRNVDVSSYFSDPDNNSLTYRVSSSHPSRATVDVSGSVVTITPVAQGGVLVLVTARDPSNLTATQVIAVTVSSGANRAPVAQGSIPAVTIAERGNPRNVDVSSYFSDPDSDTLTYRAFSSHPSQATVSVLGSVVTITPVAQGTPTITVTASDPSNLTATQKIAVTVSPGANRAPVAQGAIPTVTIAERGNPRNVDVSSYFSDPDNNSLTYRVSSSHPSRATVDVSGSVVTITPVAQGGVLVLVTARDPSNLTATQVIAVTVSSGANRAPVAQGSIPAVTIAERGNPRNVDVSSYFSDPDSDTLTYRAFSSHPSQATVSVLGSVVTITPGAQGTPIVTVSASDGNLTATQTIGVTVTTEPNRAPQQVGAIRPVTVTVGGNTDFVNVYGNFSDPDGDTLTYRASSSNPSRATVEVTGATIIITPIAEGSATVTVTASDGSLTAQQTIVVTVTTEPNRAPQQVGAIRPVTVTAGGNTDFVNVYGNFSDPDGDTLTYTAISSDPSKATVQITGATIIITPIAEGSATVTVTASDGSLTAQQTIVVTVNSGTTNNGGDSGESAPQSNRAPGAVGAVAPITLTAGDSAKNVNLSPYFSDPDGDPLIYTVLSSDTAKATVNVAGAIITITPVAEGTTTITVMAQDPAGLTATQVIVASVSPAPNRAPGAVGAIFPVTLTAGDSATPVNLSPYFSDPDGDPLTYTVLSSDTAKATVNVAGAIITITPVAEGTTTITVMAQDPAGLTATQVIVASVSPAPNRAPGAVGAIAPAKLTAGDSPTNVDLSTYFSDPDGDPLSYTAVSANTGVATVSVLNSTITVSPVAAGGTVITLIVQDPDGLTATWNLAVTVNPAPNRAPGAVGTISPVKLTAGDSPTNVDISTYFSDLDGDPLSYTAVSADTRVATVSVLSAAITITPVAKGATTATVTASDGSLIATQEIPILVVPAPNRAPVTTRAIDPVTLTAGAGPTTMDASIYFSDPDGDPLTYTAVSEDTDVVTFSVSNTILTITPLADGATTVTVTASDSSLGATQTVGILVVQPNYAPVVLETITPVTLTAGDNASTVDVADYFLDAATDVLTYSAQSSDTQVVTVNVVNSTLIIQPIAEGVTTIIVTAQDSEGLTAFQTIDITVVPVPNRAPVPVGLIDPITLVAGDSAKAMDISGYFSDPDGDMLIYSAVSTHTRVAKVNVSDITLTINPVTAGTATVMIIVQDAKGLTATRNLTVMVSPAPNRAPVVEQAIAPVTLTAGNRAKAMDISGYFSDPDNDELSYTAVSTDPDVATAEITRSTLSIRPVAQGTTTVMLTASDSQLNITQPVTLTVNTAPNRAPVTQGTIAPVTLTVEDSPITVDIAPYFSDPDNDELAYTAVSTNPGVATAEITRSTLSIRPVAQGSITIMVVVEDPEGLTVTQHITVTVNPVPNRSPVAVSDIEPITLTLRDSSITVNLSTNFSDPDNDPLTYTAVSNDATKAQVSMLGADLTIIPVLEGIVEVMVIVQDPEGLTVTQRITVTVYPAPNRAPVAVGEIAPITLTLDDSTVTVDVSLYFSDPDGDPLTYSAQSAADAVATVAIEGANLAIRPVGRGSTTVTITAQDAEAETLTRDFRVIVNTAPNAAPTFTSASVFEVVENNKIVGTVTATDTDSEDSITRYTLTAGADITLFGINPLSGALRFNDPPDFETPSDTSQTNRYIVVVQVQSGSGNRALTAEQTITVAVTDTNDAPVAVGTINPVTLTVGDAAQTVDVSTKFSDPDGDTLTYTAKSEDTMTVTVRVTDSIVTLTAVDAGRTQVTVTALDAANLAATQPIDVTVDVVVKPAAAGGAMRLNATLATVLDNTALMQLGPDSAVANGGRLKLSVDVGLTGLAVTADISALDTTQTLISLTPDRNGVYSAEIRISADNTALNGVKHILVTATDVKGDSTQLIVKTTLNNRYVTELLPNYPNPFNPETWIPYRLGRDAEVVMTIYDARGDVVRQFDLGYQPAGTYETRSRAVYWDGTNDFGEPVSTGIYFYTLTTSNYSRTRKATILK